MLFFEEPSPNRSLKRATYMTVHPWAEVTPRITDIFELIHKGKVPLQHFHTFCHNQSYWVVSVAGMMLGDIPHSMGSNVVVKNPPFTIGSAVFDQIGNQPTNDLEGHRRSDPCLHDVFPKYC